MISLLLLTVWVCGARDYGQINTELMEKIRKKLEELKKEVYYAKHADLNIIDKIDKKVKELDKLVNSSNVIPDVIETNPFTSEMAKAYEIPKDQQTVYTHIAVGKNGIALYDALGNKGFNLFEKHSR